MNKLIPASSNEFKSFCLVRRQPKASSFLCSRNEDSPQDFYNRKGNFTKSGCESLSRVICKSRYLYDLFREEDISMDGKPTRSFIRYYSSDEEAGCHIPAWGNFHLKGQSSHVQAYVSPFISPNACSENKANALPMLVLVESLSPALDKLVGLSIVGWQTSGMKSGLKVERRGDRSHRKLIPLCRFNGLRKRPSIWRHPRRFRSGDSSENPSSINPTPTVFALHGYDSSPLTTTKVVLFYCGSLPQILSRPHCRHRKTRH
jgi:hypothetical protein